MYTANERDGSLLHIEGNPDFFLEKNTQTRETFLLVIYKI
jgi:hypothetical protein